MRDLRRELASGLERLLEAADDVEAGHRREPVPLVDLTLPAPGPVPPPSLARHCVTDMVTTVVVAAASLAVGWAATGALPDPDRPTLGATVAEGSPSASAVPYGRTVAIELAGHLDRDGGAQAGDTSEAARTTDLP